MNNLALFVTHHLFLTEEQIAEVVSGRTAEAIGHCVPVWVDAKTGKTTEPAAEVFCSYKIHNSKEKSCEVEVVPKSGYEIYIPSASSWNPPEELDFEKMAEMTSEERQAALKSRDKWWFNNPRPPDAENLKSGYLRFEVKKTKQKVGRREYSAQHIVEIASLSRLENSLTS
ncbi:hypothetical protein EBT16_01580 [bacterium]|nr:hypothetical protein [bacterium]